MATTLDSYAPYDAGPGSNVTEDSWRLFAKHWRGDGVIRTGSAGTSNSNFAVFGDSTGMQVKIPSGECWIQGNWGRTTSTKTEPIAAAHGSLGRRDLVVLRNDFVNNRIETAVKTGTPNASPVYPTLTQNSAMWEIQLGKVVVGGGVVTITAPNCTALQTFTDGSCSYVVDSSFQTLVNNIDTRIDFDVPQFDSSEVDRNGLNKFILRRGGMWAIRNSLSFTGNVAGQRAVWTARTSDTLNNNRLGMAITTAFSLPCTVSGFSMERFTAGEEVAVWGYQGSGGNLTVSNDYAGSRVDFYWLGP